MFVLEGDEVAAVNGTFCEGLATAHVVPPCSTYRVTHQLPQFAQDALCCAAFVSHDASLWHASSSDPWWPGGDLNTVSKLVKESEGAPAKTCFAPAWFQNLSCSAQGHEALLPSSSQQ